MEDSTSVAPSDDAAFIEGLIAELANKSGLIWVAPDPSPPRALWHVWHDGALCVVTGGLEQPDPGLVAGRPVDVILRSKENGARQLRVTVDVERLDADDERWEGAATALHRARLNAPDGEQQPERWRRESSLWALRPTTRIAERPGAISDDSHRAEPVPSDATTAARLPFHAGRATRRRR